MARIPGQGSNWIRPTTRIAIYMRDNWACQYCDTQFGRRGFNLTLDHIVPGSRGGSNEPSNLITSCRKCNSSRQTRALASFASQPALRRIRNARRRNLNRLAARQYVSG